MRSDQRAGIVERRENKRKVRGGRGAVNTREQISRIGRKDSIKNGGGRGGGSEKSGSVNI